MDMILCKFQLYKIFINKNRLNIPKLANGKIYPPIEKRNPPKRGPNNNPTPIEASIKPIYYSLSYGSNELNIAILAVEFAPAPNPPNIYAIKLNIRN